jgi:hypothetical protein
MSHSLIGADRRTHGKIVAVALAASMSLVMLSIGSRRADSSAPTAHTPAANGPALKAGGPALSATAGAPIIR